MLRCLLLLTMTTALGAGATEPPHRQRPVRRGPAAELPRCETIRGFPSVAFTTDGGRTLPTHEETLDGVQVYTFGLAHLQTPGRLLAVTGRLLLASSDAGCAWSADGRFVFPQPDYRLVPRTSGGAWAWSLLAPDLFLFDEEGRMVRQATAPVAAPISFSSERSDPERLAIADDTGAVWWSDDGGSTWRARARTPARPPLYALEFSLHGREHLIASGLADGAHVSFDGGESWNRSAGLEEMNVFRVAFSPVAPGVVWALALDRFATGPNRRAIYHSADGGRSFRRVVQESAELEMTNGFVLAPSPADASLLYFPLPGTTLVLVDDAGRVLSAPRLPYRDVNSIAFAPGRPQLMYLGLKISDMSLAP